MPRLVLLLCVYNRTIAGRIKHQDETLRGTRANPKLLYHDEDIVVVSKGEPSLVDISFDVRGDDRAKDDDILWWDYDTPAEAEKTHKAIIRAVRAINAVSPAERAVADRPVFERIE